MTTWLLRGLVFAVGMVFLRIVQGTLINNSPTNAGLISLVLVVLFGIGALVWGFLDGGADARANPDPDRRHDLAMRWLMAGLVAGLLSGLVTFILSKILPNIYAEGIVPELTAFAAFTALLVFLPAIFGASVGRLLVDRRRPDEPRRRGQDGSEFDVFDAVRDDDRTGPIPPIPAAPGTAALDYPEENPSAVALAEREERAGAAEETAAQIHDETERIETQIDRVEDRDKNA